MQETLVEIIVEYAWNPVTGLVQWNNRIKMLTAVLLASSNEEWGGQSGRI